MARGLLEPVADALHERHVTPRRIGLPRSRTQPRQRLLREPRRRRCRHLRRRCRRLAVAWPVAPVASFSPRRVSRRDALVLAPDCLPHPRTHTHSLSPPRPDALSKRHTAAERGKRAYPKLASLDWREWGCGASAAAAAAAAHPPPQARHGATEASWALASAWRPSCLGRAAPASASFHGDVVSVVVMGRMEPGR